MGDKIATTLTCWAVTAVLAVLSLLIAGGVVSDGGRSGNNHYAALPRNVAELAADSYIISPGAPIAPGSVCVGTSTGGTSPIDAVVPLQTAIPALRGALFVRCDQDQTWDDHRPRAISWGQGIALVGVSPFYLGTYTGLMLLGCGPLLVGAVEQRRRRARVLIDAEIARRELRQGFAKGEIDRDRFEAGLDRLYGLGLKPPMDRD